MAQNYFTKRKGILQSFPLPPISQESPVVSDIPFFSIFQNCNLQFCISTPHSRSIDVWVDLFSELQLAVLHFDTAQSID
jgi:hypothetical protein